MDASQSKKLNEVNPKEVLEAVLNRKKKEFEAKYWEVKAQTRPKEECCLCPIAEAIAKIDKYCATYQLVFRRQKPTECASKKTVSSCSKTSAQINKSSKKSNQKVTVFTNHNCRWESSEDEIGSGQKSPGQSGATSNACEETECFAKVNRCTRTTFDSSQMNNSFVEPVDTHINFASGKRIGETNKDLKCAHSNAQSSPFWNTPVYRKQSENFVSNSVASALEPKPSTFLLKSKSQKRKPVLPEKETIENPPVVIELLSQKNDSLAKSGSAKQPVIGLTTVKTPTEKPAEIESQTTSVKPNFTKLDELILKHLNAVEGDHKKLKSRFKFCNTNTECPDKEPTANSTNLLSDFKASDFVWKRPEEANPRRSWLLDLILNFSFTMF